MSFAFALLMSAAMKGTIVLVAAWLLSMALRSRSAASRHLVWTAAAAALLAMPFLTAALPALRVPSWRATRAVDPGIVFRVFSTDAAAPAVKARTVATTAAPASQATRSGFSTSQWLLAIWALGTAAVLLQMVFAAFSLWRIRRRAHAFDDAGLVMELSRAVGIDYPVDVLQTAGAGMPLTFGVLRPTVLLPAGTEQWSEERRRVVLLHELAHVRRGDVATHLMARTALSLHWWNPLAWFAWREFLKERERATDDLVLQAGARASEYAGHLLEVARSMQSDSPVAWAAVAMARRSQLEGRLLAILDSKTDRRPAGRAAAVAAVAIALVLAAPFAAIQAQDQNQGIPPDVDATIRAAASQKNHQILEQAAAEYQKLKQYDVAQKLLETALTIHGETDGTQSGAYAAGLVKLGDLAVLRRDPSEAQRFYDKALSLGDRPEVAPVLLRMGLEAQRKRDAAAAEGYYQRVLNVVSTGLPASRAFLFLAAMLEREPGREGEVDGLYQRAIAANNNKSLDTASAMELYSIYLNRVGRTAEAEDYHSQAAAVRKEAIGGITSHIQPSSGTYKVGNGVDAPRLIRKIEPQYSDEARAMKYQGTVLLYVEITPEGKATNIKVARGLGMGLDEKAIEAVSQWGFRPGMKDGMPVTVSATIEVNFRLM